jgi:hypothetical protein
MKAQIIVRATALVVIVTGVVYFTGPTTKTVTVRTWQDAHCDLAHFEDKYGNKYPSNLTFDPKLRKVCDEQAPAGYREDSDTVRTNAWERIAGALTGSGHVDY